MAADDTPMLLDYAFSTDPAPIEISTAQVTNQSRVNIGVSAGAPVYCNRIVVAVPVGPDQASLFAQPPAGSMNTGRWALTTGQHKGGELWAGLVKDQDYTTFTYDCVASSDYLVNYNLVLGVFGAVNQAPGDLQIAIQENSGAGPDPSTFTPKSAFFPLRKDPPEFYLANLVATTADSPTVPCTDFAAGAPIRLAWESNGTYFQLFVKGQTAPVYAGAATTFTLSGGVARGTTFVLTASMTGSPGQDTPQGGYQPIYLYDSIAVSVSNPVLTPTSVNVAGALGVTGASTLGATNTGALTSASATVSGGLSVTGGSTLNGATVNGTLTGTGSASLKNLTVRGLSGTAGPVSLLGGGVLVAQGTNIPQAGLYAQTDGFAMAQVNTPGPTVKYSFAYAAVAIGGQWFQVLGGSVSSFKSGTGVMTTNNPNSTLVPVRANTQWYYAAGNPAGNEADSVCQIFWFPMGSVASGQQTFRTLSAEELADAPPAPAPPDFHAIAERDATAFVDRLAAALNAKLTDESRSDLARLLRQL